MKEVAWIDVNRKEYSMDEIEDGHLINIIKFMVHGGGHEEFLTWDKRQKLIDEAVRRELIKG